MKLVVLTVFFITSAASVFACGEGMPGSSSQATTNSIGAKSPPQTKPIMKKRPRCLPGPFFRDVQPGYEVGKRIRKMRVTAERSASRSASKLSRAASMAQTRRRPRRLITANMTIVGWTDRTIRTDKRQRRSMTFAYSAMSAQQCRPKPTGCIKPLMPRPKPFGPKPRAYEQPTDTLKGPVRNAEIVVASIAGEGSKPARKKASSSYTYVRMNKHLTTHSLTADM